MHPKLKSLILTMMAVAMVTFVASCGGGSGSANAPEGPTEPEQRAEPAEAPAAEQQQPAAGAEAPEDETLRLTVPKMARIQDDVIPTTVGNDEQALEEHAAIHLEGTGFPWEQEANVYIAGHRLGYPNTESFLAFWDLDALESGDEITVKDANDREYVYVSGRITNVTPVILTVEQIEPAAPEAEEVSVTGVLFEDDDFSDATYYNVRDEATGEVYPLAGGPGGDATPYLDQRVTIYGAFVEEFNGVAGRYLSVSRIEAAGGATTPEETTTLGGGTTMGETTGPASAVQYEDGGTPEQVGIDVNEDGAVDEADGQFAVQTSDEGLASTPEEGALPGTGGLILPVAGVAGAVVLLGGLLYYRKLAS